MSNKTMLNFLVIVVVSTAAVAYPTEKFPGVMNVSGRIVGGEVIPIENVPYQVSVHYMDAIQCGGTIISDQWVLSAASCFFGPPEEFTIRAGSNIFYDGGSVHKVDTIIDHPQWNWPNDEYEFDIALVHVINPFNFDQKRQAVTMFDVGEESVPGATAVISGWSKFPDGISYFLESVNLYIISKERCDEYHGDYVDLKDKICVGHPDGKKDACPGDHGGPLTIDGRLAGIISLAVYCGNDEPNVPSAHTEIAAHRAWIKNITGF